MKNNKYLFLVSLIIIVNIFLINKNYNLKNNLENIKNSNLLNNQNISKSYKIENLKDSKYKDKIVSLNIDNIMNVKYLLDDEENIHDIIEDAKSCLEISPSTVCVEDDMFLIFEFD